MIVRCKKDCLFGKKSLKKDELFQIVIDQGILCMKVPVKEKPYLAELYEIKEIFLRENFENLLL